MTQEIPDTFAAGCRRGYRQPVPVSATSRRGTSPIIRVGAVWHVPRQAVNR
jgi:hypothetical protein